MIRPNIFPVFDTLVKPLINCLQQLQFIIMINVYNEALEFFSISFQDVFLLPSYLETSLFLSFKFIKGIYLNERRKG